MAESKLTGKTRDDLATIAVVSGLLTGEQAEGMTKPQLLKYLKGAESQAAQPPVAAEESPLQTAEVKPGKVKKTLVKKTDVKVSAEAAADKIPAEVLPAAAPAKKHPAEVLPAAAPAKKHPPKVAIEKPKTSHESAAHSAGTRRPGHPTRAAIGSAASKPNNSRRTANGSRTQHQGKNPPAPSRPMRVKVFGIPQNPMALQSDEHEEALLLQSQALRAENEQMNQALPTLPANDTADIFDNPQTSAISEDAYDSSDLDSLADVEDNTDQNDPSRSKSAKKAYIESGESITGVLEIMSDGYGFLRRENYIQGARDAYVPPQYIRRFNLRPGDLITGPCKKQRDNDRYQALLYIKEVNGESPEKMLKRPHFDRLTPIYPDERYILETSRNELSTRIIDLVSPIGKGQRGMIVSPPKAGKTILLQKIANAISENNPGVKLIVLLIDERPEEVTDMQRSINGEVVFSTFDKTPENHVKITELVLERAMRLVELQQDVVILLDSMTRLGRAYNLTITPTGRTLSGGLDPAALYGPKRFFGAARNIENGGSLTIIATSLIETGSRMDEVIFEEFKGTGNMEVLLDRKLSEKRIFPAIDINKSGTRREELLLTSKELDAVWTIRKAFGQLDTAAVTETIINLLLKTTNNQQFISSINVSFNDKNVFEAMRGTRPNGNQSNNNNN